MIRGAYVCLVLLAFLCGWGWLHDFAITVVVTIWL